MEKGIMQWSFFVAKDDAMFTWLIERLQDPYY